MHSMQSSLLPLSSIHTPFSQPLPPSHTQPDPPPPHTPAPALHGAAAGRRTPRQRTAGGARAPQADDQQGTCSGEQIMGLNTRAMAMLLGGERGQTPSPSAGRRPSRAATPPAPSRRHSSAGLWLLARPHLLPLAMLKSWPAEAAGLLLTCEKWSALVPAPARPPTGPAAPPHRPSPGQQHVGSRGGLQGQQQA